MARWGNRNRVAFITTTTGTGAYVISDVVPGHQTPDGIADGTRVQGRVIHGSRIECGCYEKQGLTFVRVRIYETIVDGVGTLGNNPIDWGPGDKVFSITPLAESVLVSPDGSITISDNFDTGATEALGLTLDDVQDWLGGRLIEGPDISIVGDAETGLTISNLRTAGVVEDAALINLDVSRETGKSTHVVNIAGDRVLAVVGHSVGQVFEVSLNYDEVGGRSVTWWDGIRWLGKGEAPHITPVGGGQDTFRFQVVELVDAQNVPYSYEFLGEIVSTERPVILDLECTPNVYATVETLQQGAEGGPNEIQWLSATIDSDYMQYRIERTGTVSGGTFDLLIQLGAEDSYSVTDIPYDATTTEILEAIWTQAPFTPAQINVGSGTDGADCAAKLTDVAGLVRFEFLGADRYYGYVVSADSTNLTGGGSYQVTATAAGSGSDEWPFTLNNLTDGGNPPTWATGFKLTFNGQTTDWCEWRAGATGSYDGESFVPGVQQRLEALSNIGTGNIRVRQWNYGVYTFEFIGDLRNQNISGEIQFAPGFLPQSLTFPATGQVYGTTQNGTTPTSENEIQELTITGNPTQGYVILTIRGNVVNVPVSTTVEEFDALLYSLPGFVTTFAGPPTQLPQKNYVITGGPLPGTPIQIEFAYDLGAQDIVDSTVDTYSAGAATIDWSICNGVRVLVAGGYAGGDGTYHLLHTNPTAGETLRVTLVNEGSDFDGSITTIQQGRPASPNAIPPLSALNEVQQLVFTGSPSSGNAIIKVYGERVSIPYDATAGEVQAILETISQIVDGLPVPLTVSVTGGPLPDTAVDIEFIDTLGEQDIEDSVWCYPGAGAIEWTGDSLSLDWDGSELLTVPDNHAKSHTEFYAENPLNILAKSWFHTGVGGGGSSITVQDEGITLTTGVTQIDFVGEGVTATNVGNVVTVTIPGGGGGGTYLPGIGIEIEDNGDDTYTIDRLLTFKQDADATTILIDLDADVGEDHEFTITANRNVDVTNETLGQFMSLRCIQGGTGGYSLTFLFEVDWAEGFQPVQTPVVGKSDLFHFVCTRVSGPYVTAKFRGWVETTERPQPLDLSAAADVGDITADVTTTQASDPGVDEVQTVTLYGTPTGGTYTLGFSGQTTAGIAYNSAAATVQSALEALSNLAPGDVVCAGGPFPGTPITVTFEGTYAATNVPLLTLAPNSLTGSSISGSVTTTTAGVTGTNSVYAILSTDAFDTGPFEQQYLTGNASVTAGTFTLTVDGETTAAIAYDADTATIVDAINAALIAASKHVVCFSADSDMKLTDGGFIVFRFGDTDWGTNPNIPTMTINNSGLTGGTYSVTADVNGSGTHYQANGTFTLSVNFGGTQTTGTLTATTDPDNIIQSALASLSNVGSGNVTVTPMSADGSNVWAGLKVEFVGDLAGTDPVLTLGSSSLSLGFIEVIKQRTGGLGGVNEVQRVSLTGSPSQGTFTLTYDGETTANLPYNAAAASVEAALESLPNIGNGNVSCTGGPLPGTPIDVEFIGDLGSLNVVEMTIDYGGLLYSVVESTPGSPATNEIQRITLSDDVVGGTFSIEYDAETTAVLDYDASNAEIETALEALTGLDAVTVTGGPLRTTPVFVEFGGIVAATDVPAMIVNTDDLIGVDAVGTTIDWSLCDVALVELETGTGEYAILHRNLIPGKWITVTIKNLGATGSIITWGGDAPIVWLPGTAPDVPAVAESIEVEFFCRQDQSAIIGRVVVPEVTQIMDSPPVDGTILAGQGFFYLTFSGQTPLLKVRGRSPDGTLFTKDVTLT